MEKVLNIGQMEQNMKGNICEGRNTEKGTCSSQMGAFTRESSSTMTSTVRDLISGLMAECIQETGRGIKWKGWGE